MKHAFMGLATLLGGFLGFSQSAQAQGTYADDALLYTRLGPSGTARTLGVGGASTALGADFSNLTTNPAGLGFYTKSEITLTPGFGFGNADATPLNNGASTPGLPSQSQTANSFHIASAGVVFANRHPDNDDRSWRGGSFALGFTRQADFNQAFRYQNVTDDDHSFFQYLREPGGFGDYTSAGYQGAVQSILQQGSTGNFYNLDGLAFGNYLTDPVRVRRPGGAVGDSIYRIATPARLDRNGRAVPITQNERVISTGSQSQFDLGYGGNFNDKFYIGGGIGIVSLNRTRTATFSESSDLGFGPGEDFNFTDYVKTTGTGVNARLGVIYRPVDVVRIGASFQTPTYIRLNDEYTTTLTANQDYLPNNTTPNVLSTTPGTLDYSITTPFRANGGLVVLLNKYGFLTGDVEYVGYSQARFHTNDNDVNGDLDVANQDISTGYRNTVNLRAGAEGRFDVLRVRVGYAHYGNPYSYTSPNRAQNYFTGGLGIRTKGFFVDVAGVYLAYKDEYSPYSLANSVSPAVDINQHRFTASITGGLTF
jgi:hypothetical protein